MLLVGGGDEGVGRCIRKRRRIRLSEHCPEKARSFVRTFEDNVMESGTAAHHAQRLLRFGMVPTCHPATPVRLRQRVPC